MKNSVPLSTVIEKYLNVVSCSKKGWMQELYRANVIKKYEISNKAIKDITTKDVASYRDERLETFSDKTRRKISGNSVRLELAFLSSVFKTAQTEWGLVKDNPVASVRKPKPNKGRDRRISTREEKTINKHLLENNLEMWGIFNLALETAMRQGEILGLRWENINLSLGEAYLPDTKNGTARYVPLSKVAREIFLGMNPLLKGRVFSYTSNGFKSRWRKTMEKLKIDDLHFHDTRHEAISRLFEMGTLNVMEVAAISGHKSLAMLKRYTHLKAYQLARKIDSKNKNKKKIASYFVPYPALGKWIEQGYEITFIDFDELTVTGKDKQETITKAATRLLHTLALAAQSGSRLPLPGSSGVVKEELFLVNPLM